MYPSGHYVYFHCKPDWTPFYVGKGQGRRGTSIVSKNRNKFHQDVVGRYGAKQIRIITIPCENEAHAFDLERTLIASLRQTGYLLANFNDGGEGSTNPSSEIRAKMRAAKIGKTWSAEHCANISAALKGRKKSPEHVAKVSAALKGRSPDPIVHQKRIEATKGRKLSSKHRAAISRSNQGRKHTAESVERMKAIQSAMSQSKREKAFAYNAAKRLSWVLECL